MRKKKGIAGVKVFLAGFGVLCALVGLPAYDMAVRAAETDTSAQPGSLMKARQAVDMKAEPDAASETIMSYEKDASVFVAGETADGWYLVLYQDKEGYVPKESLRPQEMDVEELNEEMEEIEQEAKFVVESVEKYREEMRRSKIWGGVIIALVAGIFVIGIIAGIRSGK